MIIYITMATRYLDLNAQQSNKINETNNRYSVKLNETLKLPTGSQISIHNSLINLQGITGQSIELEKDFNETILFNYYAVDTSYLAPVLSLGNPSSITSFNLYVDIAKRLNVNLIAPFQFSSGGLPAPSNAANFYEDLPFGFSEIIMPLAGVKAITDEGGTTANFLVPLSGKAEIRIPKGIYSVESLGNLISDQINLVIEPNSNKTSYDYKKTESEYNGLLVNNTTNRAIQTPEPVDWEQYLQGGLASPQNQLPAVRALTKDDTDIYGAYAVRPDHMNDIFFQAQTNVYNVGQPNDSVQENECVQATGTARRYMLRFEKNNGENADYESYNLFTEGTMMGTTGFKLDYNSDSSGYSLSHLHEPRRIPTNDRRGNQMDNPSAECVYSKRVYDPNVVAGSQLSFNYYDGMSAADKKTAYETLNAVVQRYSGIQIYNWAFETAQKEGNVDILNFEGYNNRNPNNKDFWNFKQFFNKESEARAAWETTLWFRLGFTYDELVDEKSFLKERAFGVDYTLHGTTTGANIDPSIIPFISTNYNDYERAAPTDAKPEGNQSVVLPSVTTIQMFNLLDVNVPSRKYNNNKVLKNNANDFVPIAVSQYIGSFYDYAVMFPVQTSGDELVATNLPRLSTNGYMLVLSDVVNQDDQAGINVETGILDMIPKSSLSNQDFIANTNDIIHILSNPKVINEIEINILNPDLTDIPLQPNTTILLKIITPMSKPTEIISRTEDNMAIQQIETQVAKQEAAEQKAEQKAQKKK